MSSAALLLAQAPAQSLYSLFSPQGHHFAWLLLFELKANAGSAVAAKQCIFKVGIVRDVIENPLYYSNRHSHRKHDDEKDNVNPCRAVWDRLGRIGTGKPATPHAAAAHCRDGDQMRQQARRTLHNCSLFKSTASVMCFARGRCNDGALCKPPLQKTGSVFVPSTRSRVLKLT